MSLESKAAGFFVIEALQGEVLASGWVYGSGPDWYRFYGDFDDAKRRVDKLCRRGRPKGRRWAVVVAKDWLEAPTDVVPLYEELGR